MKKCDVCKGYPATYTKGDGDNVLAMCFRCYIIYDYDSDRDELTTINDKDDNPTFETFVVAKVYANGIDWKNGYSAPNPHIGEITVHHRPAPTPDERARKITGVAPGYPVTGRWRRCTSPGTICMFRYDLNVPVNDEEHGYVEVVPVLLCPLHLTELASCPANQPVPRPVPDDE